MALLRFGNVSASRVRSVPGRSPLLYTCTSSPETLEAARRRQRCGGSERADTLQRSGVWERADCVCQQDAARCFSAVLLYHLPGLGDVLCQLLLVESDATESGGSGTDIGRTLRMALVGGVLVGPTLHFWSVPCKERRQSNCAACPQGLHRLWSCARCVLPGRYGALNAVVRGAGLTAVLLRLAADQFLFAPLFIGLMMACACSHIFATHFCKNKPLALEDARPLPGSQAAMLSLEGRGDSIEQKVMLLCRCPPHALCNAPSSTPQSPAA